MSAPQQITSFISEANAAGRHTYQNDPWEAAATDEEKKDSWLLSYIDILTLFLTLFVVLLVLQPKGEEESTTQNSPAIHIQSLEHPEEKGVNHALAPEILAPIQEPTAPLPIVTVETAEPLSPPRSPLPEEKLEAKKSLEQDEPVKNKPDALNTEQAKSQSAVEITDINPETQISDDQSTKAINPGRNIASTAPFVSPIHIQPTAEQKTPADLVLEQLTRSALSDRLAISRIAQGVNLEVRDNILFAPGQAKLKPEGVQLLSQLAQILSEHEGIISIEGHTDNRPIANQRFPSNWELSSGRATIVARHLISQRLSPTQLRAVGYADTRPLATNLTAQGRARNRRVTLILEFPQKETEQE